MCQFCQPEPCFPLVQEPPKGGSGPGAPLTEVPSPLVQRERELTTCRRAFVSEPVHSWTSVYPFGFGKSFPHSAPTPKGNKAEK